MKNTISEQAEKYAEVIVGQIAGNFTELYDSIKDCDKLNKIREEYKKSKDQSTFSTFFFDKNIDEYIGYVKKVEEETQGSLCDGYSTIEPLAVGLFGEWGSGKTYQLKLIKQYILYPPKEITFSQVTIPVFFNAWRFEKEEHIILPLFETLLDTLEKYERSPVDKAKIISKSTLYHVKNIVTSLHTGINISSAVKTAKGLYMGDVEGLAEAKNILDTKAIAKEAKKKTDDEQLGSQNIKELLKPEELKSIYLNIPAWIEKVAIFEKVNFVFLIDDLDRCLPENTLKMLESIKLFLDVPSCAFVLAVDDDVVERGVVHHYRDYLSIYHGKDTEGSKCVLQHELPITGHEYLEKMIQLPMRLPVISTQNAREYLEKETQESWKKELNEKMYAQVLDYFACAVPSKPRKLKRVALLYQTKLILLKALDVDELLLAKITLLELFAPKILRFIQNHGYGKMYDRLNYFVENDDNVTSLSDIESIKTHIKEHDYKEVERNTYNQLVLHIEEHQRSRVVFDLDKVFNRQESRLELRKIIELNANKDELKCSNTDRREKFEGLDTLGDVVAWKNALETEGEVASKELKHLLKIGLKEDKTFDNLSFLANPEWVGVVAEYLNKDEYVEMLKASHDARFKTIEDKTQIDMFQLTFSEYDKYCDIKELDKPKDKGWGRGKRPVINVSWQDAKDYIGWLNDEKIGNYSLPTEDEWYLACNNGKNTKWYFGDDESKLKDYAWYNVNSDRKTHPVGEKKPNDLGLYDMHGNVWEWCEDWYDKDTKVLRGGSWFFHAYYTRSANRYSNFPSYRNFDVGFRLLRTLRS